jgi:hypothetical protein
MSDEDFSRSAKFMPGKPESLRQLYFLQKPESFATPVGRPHEAATKLLSCRNWRVDRELRRG